MRTQRLLLLRDQSRIRGETDRPEIRLEHRLINRVRGALRKSLHRCIAGRWRLGGFVELGIPCIDDTMHYRYTYLLPVSVSSPHSTVDCLSSIPI